MTRAKFRVDSITQHAYHTGKTVQGVWVPELKIMHTVKMAPVYGNGDPEHENSKFWEASPSGALELGTVNPDAVAWMKPGDEVYIDISPAPKS